MNGAIILNPGCPNDCFFCGRVRIKNILVQAYQEHNAMRNLDHLKQQGATVIEISGTDPIEHRSIARIVEKTKQKGFSKVILSTHGRQLSDPLFARQLVKAGVDEFRIPLYGSQAAIHDAITRTPGSFELTVKGIRNVTGTNEDKSYPDTPGSPRSRVTISSLITRPNLRDLTKIADLARSLGASYFYFSIPCLSSNEHIDYYVPFKELMGPAKEVYDHSKKTGFPIHFREIPFCIFGHLDSDIIDNKCTPPDLGKYCQPPRELRSGIKDMPSYRIKRKIEACEGCAASELCDGFFANDIDRFGIPDIKKIS